MILEEFRFRIKDLRPSVCGIRAFSVAFTGWGVVKANSAQFGPGSQLKADLMSGEKTGPGLLICHRNSLEATTEASVLLERSGNCRKQPQLGIF